MKRSRRSRRMAWMALAGILALQEALPVWAAEPTAFGQLISGDSAGEGRRPESEYMRISIATEEDLARLALDCQVDAWSRDKYVTLENDIVLREHRGLTIPSFGGIFDGGEHTVSGLELAADGSAVGLFRYVQEGGVVRGLALSGTVAPGGSKSQVGILAGINYGRIENCSVSGNVAGAEDVGGIAGANRATGEIRRCQSAAYVTGDHCAGGICGSNQGTINNCQNLGSVNTHSTEVSYSIEDITMEGIEDINSAKNVAVHTDTGGIAGYSDGKIYYCANSGTVGYQHVGYNTGGIVGRLHQGYLQNCTNTGHVLGRKDVGGIAGQLEPFLEIQYLNDKLGELDRETEVFFNLLEAAHEDISGYGEEAAELSRSISGHLNTASAAGAGLTGTANELWYIYNQELTGIGDDLSRLNGEWRDQAEAGTAGTGTDESGIEGSGIEGSGTEASGINLTGEVYIGDMQTEQESGEGNPAGQEGAGGQDSGESAGVPSEGQAQEASAARTEAEDAAEQEVGPKDPAEGEEAGADAGEEDGGQNPGGGADGSHIFEGDADRPGADETDPDRPDFDKPDIDKPDFDFPDFDKTDIDKADIEKLGKDIESYMAALRRFGEGVGTHLGTITSATSDRSGGIGDNLQTLNQELEAAGNDLLRLAEVLQQGGDRTSADVDALLAQAKVVRRCINELRDDLFRYEGITVEDASDEAAGGDLENLGAEQPQEAYYDTTSFQQGKITLCINQGTVEADTNVGGITGLIATEYDFDPEDDITLTGAESFRIEQSVKAVVRESRNLGAITGKKDYVGGVVGKADFGAVVSCESYGAVESTGGSFVGGIAGSSDYCVRSCYAMGPVSGETYVGGIAGRGCDIFYSYAYPEIDCSGERAGSVAGWLREEGILWGNYYVQGNVPGVDSVGYESGAAPLPYEEFCRLEGVPEAFSEFTVSLQADGRELASFRCAYGDAIDGSLIPQVPEKEGYYGTWPDFDWDFVTGNQVLEARYERWVTSLASEEKDAEGRPLVLVQGEFLPESRLKLEQGPEGGTRLSVWLDGREPDSVYESGLLVRALCEDAEHTTVELWTGNGYQAVESSTVGSYLEFPMEGGPALEGESSSNAERAFRLTAAEKDNGKLVAIACAGGCAAAAALLILLIGKARKRRGKPGRKGMEQQEKSVRKRKKRQEKPAGKRMRQTGEEAVGEEGDDKGNI